jgi:hypothetical protein
MFMQLVAAEAALQEVFSSWFLPAVATGDMPI